MSGTTLTLSASSLPPSDAIRTLRLRLPFGSRR
jgi:hypothetical protein